MAMLDHPQARKAREERTGHICKWMESAAVDCEEKEAYKTDDQQAGEEEDRTSVEVVGEGNHAFDEGDQ